jgi:Putative DNA-binding domain
MSKKFYLDKIFTGTTIRLVTAVVPSLICGFLYHNYYYDKSLYNVQTVDFNTLQSVLPAELSLALIRKESQSIQDALDSNFSLYGLVVTDCKYIDLHCPNQKILYYSNSHWNEKVKRWQSILNEGESALENHPYDLLRNPPPIHRESKYESPSNDTWKPPTGLHNSGQVIGRVYYLRNIKPDYWNELWNAFISLSKGQFEKIGYITTFVIPILIVYLIFYIYKSSEGSKVNLRSQHEIEVRELITRGEEGNTCDFQAALFWNNHTLKTDEKVTLYCIKKIASFMNSEGGVVIIGVAQTKSSDQVQIIGIEEEIRLVGANSVDGYILKFQDQLKAKLGSLASSIIEIQPYTFNERKVLSIRCKRSDDPIFVNREEFYVRQINRCEQLKGTELTKYTSKHFKNSLFRDFMRSFINRK